MAEVHFPVVEKERLKPFRMLCEPGMFLMYVMRYEIKENPVAPIVNGSSELLHEFH
jgi:hypothetical protein